MTDLTPPVWSIWTQATYAFDGFEAVATDFSDAQGDTVALVADDGYYARSGLSGDEVLELPSFELLLSRYFDLDPDRQDRFLRWC
jgi:hypothetical protein